MKSEDERINDIFSLLKGDVPYYPNDDIIKNNQAEIKNQNILQSAISQIFGQPAFDLADKAVQNAELIGRLAPVTETYYDYKDTKQSSQDMFDKLAQKDYLGAAGSASETLANAIFTALPFLSIGGIKNIGKIDDIKNLKADELAELRKTARSESLEDLKGLFPEKTLELEQAGKPSEKIANILRNDLDGLYAKQESDLFKRWYETATPQELLKKGRRSDAFQRALEQKGYKLTGGGWGESRYYISPEGKTLRLSDHVSPYDRSKANQYIDTNAIVNLEDLEKELAKNFTNQTDAFDSRWVDIRKTRQQEE